MDKVTFARGLAILRASYPQSRADLKNEETIEVWYLMLGDLDGDCFTTGIKRIVQKEKFLPSIAEIRECARRYQSTTESTDIAIPHKITDQQQQLNRQKIKELISGLKLTKINYG